MLVNMPACNGLAVKLEIMNCSARVHVDAAFARWPQTVPAVCQAPSGASVGSVRLDGRKRPVFVNLLLLELSLAR
jgi:hypothetical protein